MNNHLTRRRFLATAGTAASVTLFGQSLLGLGNVLAAPLRVRRNVGNMDASDPILLSYRAAIKAMKALPATNPLSWDYQAAIHGTFLAPPKPAWNTCEHGTYFFWSWHRMYLYWFEQIIRKMCGDNCWTLPYWDWSSPSQRQLPPPFRDATSELFTTNRNPAMNSGAGSLPAGHVNYSTAFALLNFTNASSSLEITPHAAVHVDIGGWMGSVPTAAQDPIFYLHHCNIDRLWNLWLAQGGGRTDPLTDATWKNTKFTFLDTSSAVTMMTGCEVLRAAQQLGYVYEAEPAQVLEFCPRSKPPKYLFAKEVVIRLPIPPIVLTPDTVSFPLDVKELRGRLPPIVESPTSTLFLELDDVEAERPPGIVWDVFVHPANAKPSPESFVGNIALFGSGIRSESHHEFKPAHFAFPINRAMSAALKTNEDRLQVSFVPQGIQIDGKPSTPKAQSTVRIGRASLTVETAKSQE